MKRKDITVTKEQHDWLEKHPDYNLSQNVRNMLNKDMKNEPWATTTIQHTPGIEIGTNNITQTPITYNRFDSPTDNNWLITGEVAAGKTTGSLIHLTQYLNNPDITTPVIITLDPLGTTTQLTTHHQGKQLTVTDDSLINPFHLPSYTHTPKVTPDKRTNLKGFFNTLLTSTTDATSDTNTLTTEQWTLLEDTINTAYETHDITLSNTDTYHTNTQPTLQDDVIPLLTKIGTKTHETTTPYDADEDASIATTLLNHLDPIHITNSIPGQFTGHTDLDFPRDSPPNVIQIDLTRVTQSTYTTLLYTALTQAYEYAASLTDNVIIYIDEGTELLKKPTTMNALTAMFRNARHHNISIQFSAQNIEHFIGTDHFQSLWDLSSHKLMYKDNSIKNTPKTKLGIEEVHKQYIHQAKRGSKETGYSQAALKLPNTDWQPINIHPTTETQHKII